MEKGGGNEREVKKTLDWGQYDAQYTTWSQNNIQYDNIEENFSNTQAQKNIH